jgi:hypothetical protein
MAREFAIHARDINVLSGFEAHGQLPGWACDANGSTRSTLAGVL